MVAAAQQEWGVAEQAAEQATGEECWRKAAAQGEMYMQIVYARVSTYEHAGASTYEHAGEIQQGTERPSLCVGGRQAVGEMCERNQRVEVSGGYDGIQWWDMMMHGNDCRAR